MRGAVRQLSGVRFRFVLLATLIAVQSFILHCTSTTQQPKIIDVTTEESESAAQEEAAPEETMTPEEMEYQAKVEYNYGWPYFQSQQYEEALPYFWNVIKYDKKNQFTQIYRQMTQMYIDLAKPDSALLVSELGLEINPENMDLLEWVQYIHRATNQVPEAIEATKKLIELGQDTDERYIQLKDLYLKEDDRENVIAVYDELIKRHPDNQIYVDDRMAIIRSQGATSEEIIGELLKSHEKFPNEPSYIEEILRQYERDGDYTKVIEYADKRLVLDSKNVYALEKKVDAFDQLQRFNERITVLKELAAITNNNPLYLCEISGSYIELKQYVTARTWAQRALRKNSRFGLAYIRIGEAYQYSANDCVDKREGGKILFDDKLVYQLAYNQFQRARNIGDEYSNTAASRMNSIRGYLPSKEDLFMHPNQKKSKLDCHQWMY